VAKKKWRLCKEMPQRAFDLGGRKQSFNGADNGWLPTFYFLGQPWPFLAKTALFICPCSFYFTLKQAQDSTHFMYQSSVEFLWAKPINNHQPLNIDV